jgi:predicted membrane-bound spermidine synthase
MLASFRLGIAIGSAVAARLARDASRAALGLAIAQLGAAVLSTVAFVGLGRIPELANALGAGHAGAPVGNAVITVLVLLPGSLCIGAVFPFAVRLLARDETQAGPAAARVYVWNTFGSIAGALAGGFLLLPALRFEGTLMLAAAVNLALALAITLAMRPVAKAVAGLATAGLALLLVVQVPTPWGVLRHSAMLGNASRWDGEVAFYAVGRSSTVLLVEQPDGLRMTTNGLPESIIPPRSTGLESSDPARWLGMLPALLRPGLEDILVIGLGGGLTVAAVPSSVEDVTVIELEDEVLQAHEWLASQGEATPIHDPRVSIVVNDARGALQLTDRRFGAIVSQPSHPWTAGASHLYTRNFFSLVTKHLEPGGIFVQWIGLAFVDPTMVGSLVASLLDVFPHVGIFAPVQGALLFAASDAPLDPVATAADALAAAPADYSRFGLSVPEDVAACWVLDTDQARDFAGSSSSLTDDDNPLATRSARVGKRRRTDLARDLFARYEPLRFDEPGLDPYYLIGRIATRGAPARALRLAQSAPKGPQRLTAIGWAKIATAPRQAAPAFKAALDADPTAQSARFGLLLARRQQVEEGDPSALALAEPLEGGAGAVVQGWRHAALGAWDEVRTREDTLAGVARRDPSRVEALRLRILWRIEGSDPDAFLEASRLAEELLEISDAPADTVLAARAHARAERQGDALLLIDRLSRTRRREAEQNAAVALLEELRADVDGEEWDGVRRRLTRRGDRGAAQVP